MKEKIELKNLPDKIWIQVGEIDIDFDNDFKKLRESNEVTWCEHKIDNWDIEYTRSSLIESLINQEVEKRIAERMPSEEEVLQYFNNHFDCYADAEHVEIAMTNTAVLKLIWWFRNRMEGKA